MPCSNENGGRQPSSARIARIVHLERARELLQRRRKFEQRDRKRKQPRRMAERGAERAAQIRRGYRRAIAQWVRAPRCRGSIHTAHDRVGEIADVDQAAPVLDARERQRQPAIDRAHQREESSPSRPGRRPAAGAAPRARCRRSAASCASASALSAPYGSSRASPGSAFTLLR